MALLALTALSSRLALGGWALPVALGIAFAKLALIYLFFMQLKYQRGLVRIFATAGFFWLAVAGLLTFSDYLTRGWRI
jgi:cytochrome c oxidase subunit 4